MAAGMKSETRIYIRNDKSKKASTVLRIAVLENGGGEGKRCTLMVDRPDYWRATVDAPTIQSLRGALIPSFAWPAAILYLLMI
jgi:hypothetical protein